MPDALGIEVIKESLDTVITVVVATDQALEDNKIDWLEGVSLGIKAVGFWKIVKNAKQLKDEFLDLDELEKAELSAYFTEKFDIRDDQLEAIVEKIFEALLQLTKLLELLKIGGEVV